MSIIALLTDFGPRGSHYVAAMKAVILDINPKLKIIDISHTTEAFSIIEAAYLLKSTYSYFPKGTAFVVVVDPGVGSQRGIVAIETADEYYFVGPDNGIFPAALRDAIKEGYMVENEQFFHKPVSNTFHGRDIMSPVAAHIHSGVLLEDLGSAVDPIDLREVQIPFEINEKEKKINCTVQYVDDFGNITTNIAIKQNKIEGTDIILLENQNISLLKGNSEKRGKFTSHFGAVPKKSLLFLKGSTSYLEISLNQGNASADLNIFSGDNIELQFQ
ncbi:MAG: Adenosyl-chloride synthase [Promethearchaeota archaeon]|nr:MAG: Adenosyl-chloride synthase [Candidatus Lokiarchaeota archaeon]